MITKKIIALVVLLAVFLVAIFYINEANNKKEVIAPVSDYKNASYFINGEKIDLVNGVFEKESAPGSASKDITKYFGNEVMKDLNNDGHKDVAFLLTQETGGSGTFFYVVAALNTESGYVGSHGVLLGDRIAPQTTESGEGNSIVVNYVDRAFGEPMSTQPSVGKSLRLILDPVTMQFGEVANNFEGEADPARMDLSMKTWKWVRAEYSDGSVVSPKKDSFSITLKEDGTFSASTDCNGLGGKYSADSASLSFKDSISTLMYCEDSQESEFLKIIENTESYEFTSKGELVLNLKSETGVVYFK